ncbi:MAG: hypothetical protein FJ272_04265, partial [Planctomycetes bacterium]|nr:hypothetical protein [Planctomycetota bacterium]
MKCYLWLMIAGGALSVLSTALRAQGATGEGRIRILADNVAGGLGSDWPMYCGVPCPRGMLKDPRQVRVVDAQGQPAPTQARVLSRWAGTDDVRWLGVDFLGDPNRPYFVERTAPGAEGWDSLIARQGNDFVINTGPARFVVPSSGPLIARAYLDLNGDGKFTEDEMVIQNVGGDDLYVVDNRGRKAIAGKDASAEQAVSEPENASVHACVRREGWYVTDSGDKVARHITRLHFCRGKSFVRIQHTLVLTEDTNKLWFRDIGVRFGHRIPDAAKVTFDASHEFDDAALTTTLAGADRVAYLFQEKYFSFSRMDPEKDARFVIAKVGESAEAVLKTGQRCGEWVDVSGEKAGVALAVRHLWQQFPKELEVSPDAVTARLWSSRGGRELDVRMETL